MSSDESPFSPISFPRIDTVKDKLLIVIFGSYRPPEVKQKLVNLKLYLQRKGYRKCNIVEDFDYPQQKNGQSEAEYLMFKCYYWLERTDVAFFLLFKDVPKEGVTLEMKHMLDNLPQKITNCVVFVERNHLSVMIKGELDLHERELKRADFETEDELHQLAEGYLINFLKQFYYRIRDRED